MYRFKTAMLMAAMTMLLVVLGSALGGKSMMFGFFGFAVLMNVFTYWFSDKIVLKMYNAREVNEAESPEFYNMVRNLAQKAGMPMPRVYIIPDSSPNAFATGRDPEHAAVAATEGILRMLTRSELEGVMAHELTHVLNRDILVSTIASVLAAAITMLARFAIFFGGRDDEDSNPIAAIAMMIFAPIAAMLIQMAISRSREYMADAGGAKLCGNPMSLADALRKLHRGVEAVPMDANPATSNMFIVNPFSARGVTKLFSTHPPMEERIARLEDMARGRG
ncbi:MAG: zinc metalloprotease HtpX [Nitrospirae bacterium]|nr:zinc metalloprotease HtpX [Nitrospirota bacterium]